MPLGEELENLWNYPSKYTTEKYLLFSFGTRYTFRTFVMRKSIKAS